MLVGYEDGSCDGCVGGGASKMKCVIVVEATILYRGQQCCHNSLLRLLLLNFSLLRYGWLVFYRPFPWTTL